MTHICETLGVNRAADYAWRIHTPGMRELADAELQPIVRNIFLQHRRRYSVKRIAKELASMGYTCSRSRVRKIMENIDLIAIQPRSFKPHTTVSNHRLGYSPNLLAEGVLVTHCNQVWVGDITYVGMRSRFA